MLINIVYASTSGNVEATVEQVAKILKTRGIESVLNRAEKTPIEVIIKNKFFIFATSTWEHGKLNPYFEHLYTAMSDLNLRGKQAAFIGLGDVRYEPVLFCEGMEKVRDLWLKNGGEEIGNRLRINGEPYDKFLPLVEPWTDLFTKTLAIHNAK